ncbi:MAG: DUF6471 domain-containing protein [Pseudomonadota bacterium]|nr:DUF6471 domain-containing protein [Pseudomonadota bacterium]
MNWDAHARLILKAEIVRRGMTYDRLAERMQAMGLAETPRAIANKMSRGTFSFVFFLQCMRALEATTVTLAVPDVKPPPMRVAGSADLDKPLPQNQ